MAACEKPAGETFTPVINVHGLLRRGMNRYNETPLWVNRTYAIDEPPARLLHGAGVMMWRGEDTWRLAEGYHNSTHDSAYFLDGVLPVRLASFDTVGLRVAREGFDTVEARTVVPDTFFIVYPDSGDTITPLDSMVWRRSRGAHGYLVGFSYVYEGEEWHTWVVVPDESIRGMPFDTLYARVPLYFLNYTSPGQHVMRILAMDSNYYTWTNEAFRNPRPGSGFLSAGVEGGVGVFGSGCEAEVQVWLRRDSTPGPRIRGTRPRPPWNPRTLEP
jgi:hypothetical protein